MYKEICVEAVIINILSYSMKSEKQENYAIEEMIQHEMKLKSLYCNITPWNNADYEYEFYRNATFDSINDYDFGIEKDHTECVVLISYRFKNKVYKREIILEIKRGTKYKIGQTLYITFWDNDPELIISVYDKHVKKSVIKNNIRLLIMALLSITWIVALLLLISH